MKPRALLLRVVLLLVLAAGATPALAVTADELLTEGNTKFGNGKYSEAITDYTQAIALNPQYADAYYNRGNVKHFKGDQDGAIADYTLAIALNPH